MARIAHLSDFHLLEPGVRDRRGKDWFRVHYLSLKRSLDYLLRRTRAEKALVQARDAGFDHLVITGDLTEDGHLAQFEVLAEVLTASGIPAEKILLCPGNHDSYGMSWQDAMAGPLRRWSRTEAWLDDAVIVAVSTAVPQTFLRSSGRVDDADLRRVDSVAAGERRRAVVAAQHHPPFALFNQWVHGLQDHARVKGLMESRDNVNVLHGHTHKHQQRALVEGGPLRVFSPTAVADSAAPLRLYDVRDGALVPVPVEEGLLAAVAHEAEAIGHVAMDEVRHEVEGIVGR